MADFHPLTYVKAHPLITGGVVFVGGLILLGSLGVFGGGGGGSQSGNSASGGGEVDDYLQAQSTEAQAGDAVQVAAINAQAGTAQTQLNDAAAISINNTGTAADVTENAGNNATAITLAPDEVQASLFSALASIASQPGGENKTTSTNSGFLGIGAGSSATEKYVPNPAAETAADTLTAALQQFSSTGG